MVLKRVNDRLALGAIFVLISQAPLPTEAEKVPHHATVYPPCTLRQFRSSALPNTLEGLIHATNNVT